MIDHVVESFVISVADIVVRHLRDAGVGFVFGVPGGGSNLDLIDAARRAEMPFVLTATETGAALAAIAQAEIGGRPGVCLATLGPGVASVVNGVACAWLDRAPLLVFTDSQPVAGAGDFSHQWIDHRALLAPITKWSAVLSPANANMVMRDAIDCAMTEPRGPVHIQCPGRVRTAAASLESPPPSPGSEGLALLDPAALAPLLSGARRPLLLIGLGARRPLDAE